MILFVSGSLITAYSLGYLFGYGQLMYKKLIEVSIS